MVELDLDPVRSMLGGASHENLASDVMRSSYSGSVVMWLLSGHLAGMRAGAGKSSRVTWQDRIAVLREVAEHYQ
jgi:hypothetical protein